MASFIAVIRYALLETFFCISILPKTHIGYPVLIEKIHSTKTNQDYLKIAPVFLFPVEITGGAVSVATIPHVNMEVIKQYSSRDTNSQVYDLIDLENELGFCLRNHADRMEQKVCELREQWSRWFNDITEPEADNCELTLKQYINAYDAWYRTYNSFLGKLFCFFAGKSKSDELNKCLTNQNKYFSKYEMPIIATSCDYLESNTK